MQDIQVQVGKHCWYHFSMVRLMDILKKLNKRKVSFKYETQTQSGFASDDVVCKGNYGMVTGTILPENVRHCNNGNFVVTLKNMNRRKKSCLGQGDFPNLKKNSPLWRSYRFDGIDFSTLKVKRDGKWHKVICLKTPMNVDFY